MKIPRTALVTALLLSLLLPVAPAVGAEPTPPSAPAALHPAKPRRGEVLKLEGNSITAMPFMPPFDSQRSEPQTYVLDDETRITVGRLTGERKTPSGQKVQSFKAERGTREDLKVGQQVRIDAEGDRAVRITILSEPADPKKE